MSNFISDTIGKISIRIKLFVVFLLVSSAAILINSFGVIGISRSNLEKRLNIEQKVVSKSITKIIEQYIYDVNMKLAFVINIERDGIKVSDIVQGILLEEIQKNNNFLAIATIDPKGQVTNKVLVEDAQELQLSNLGSDEVYKLASETGRVQLGAFELAKGRPVLKIVYPLERGIGCVYLIVGLEMLKETIVNISKAGNMFIYLVDEKGKVLLDSSELSNGKSFNLPKLKSAENFIVVNNPQGVKIKSIVSQSIIKGVYILAGQDVNVLNKPVIYMLSMTFIWLIVTIGIVFFASMVFSKQFVNPILTLVNCMKNVSKGNMDCKIEVKSKDEIGFLAESFNTMTVDLKNLHEELVKNERLTTIGQLSATIGHEIRNPLSTITMAALLLSGYKGKEPDREEVKRLSEVISHELFIINKISENLLGYSRERPPAKEEIDLNTLIWEVVGLIKAPEKVVVKVNITGKIKILGEPVEMRQVLINLIDNAVDIMKKTGGEVNVGAADLGSNIQMWISDNGPGISEENMKKLFKPLFSTKTKGTGLGLAVVKRVIDRHKGKIETQSKVGAGTKFLITLPK